VSYEVKITGHMRNEHNAKVKEIAEDAYAKVAALHAQDEFAPTLSGYSGDQTGHITLATPQEPTAADETKPEPSAESGTG